MDDNHSAIKDSQGSEEHGCKDTVFSSLQRILNCQQTAGGNVDTEGTAGEDSEEMST